MSLRIPTVHWPLSTTRSQGRWEFATSCLATVDTAVLKCWNLTECQSFPSPRKHSSDQLRFDIFSTLPEIDISGSFGKFTHTLNGPRGMEFMLRYRF